MKKGTSYTIVATESGDTTALSLSSKEDVAKIIEDNRENCLNLPLSVLDNFERASKVLKKAFAKDLVVCLDSEQVSSSKPKRFAITKMLMPLAVGSIMVPATVFRMLSAITGSAELAKINCRLDDISNQIERLNIRQQAEIHAKLSSVIVILNELEDEYKSIVRFSADMISRLTWATAELKVIYFQSAALLENHHSAIKTQLNSKKQLKELTRDLNSRSGDYRFDEAINMMALKAQVMLGRLWLIHDLIYKPEYVDKRIVLIEKDLQILVEKSNESDLLSDYSQEIKTRFNKLSRIKKRLLGKEIAKQLASFTQEEQSVLVQDSAGDSFVIVKDRHQVLFIPLNINRN